jgi:type I restriction enzyme S subunit
MSESLLVKNFDLLTTAPGGVARLQELILTLAVQGKLVSQDHRDTPTRALLEKIAVEKDQLITEKKLKREKEAPELSGAELPFELPISWEWVALGEVIDIVRGITFPATQKTREPAPGRIACLRTTNVQQTIEWDDLLFVDRSFMGREDQVIQSQDIVMSMANSRELVGKVALIEHIPHPEATFGGFLGVLRPRMIEPKYAMAVLRTPYARSMLIDSASQTTNIANVSLGKLRPMPFPLPPANEQTRIVARVEELMKLCDSLERNGRLADEQHARLTTTLFGALAASESAHALAENWQRVAESFDLLLDRPEAVDALEQTVMRLAVRGKLVAQQGFEGSAASLIERIRARKTELVATGQIKKEKILEPIDEVPFELPANWKWVRLGTLGARFDYGTSQKSVDNPAAVPVLRMGNIQGGVVVMTGLKYLVDELSELPDLYLKPGDLLFNRTNSYELVGKTAMFEGYVRDVTFASYLIRIRLMEELCLPEYVNLYLNTIDCRRLEIEPDLTQQTGQANYNGTKLQNIRIPLPPFAEQKRIVWQVNELRQLCIQIKDCMNESMRTLRIMSESEFGHLSQT